jgi:ectoine hydroxylase-related dioxygenase (phytanoyl-CoA dioxygenase family)
MTVTNPTLPDRRKHTDLDEPYALTPAQIQHFREQGFIKLKHVFSAATLDHYGREITAQVKRLNTLTVPMEQRNTYQKAFLQVMNIWTKSDVVKEFSFSKRLARIAAELLGVKGVRMYHDQALYKEAGGGITPWHADQYYWPLSNGNTCTVWVPLQATPLEMGPLAFSARSHRFQAGRDLEISDESEKRINKALLEEKLSIEESAFDLGEVSYHYGWTFHRAGVNQTDRARAVMTVIYMEDGIRLIEPKNKNHIADWNTWMAGTKVGEVAATHLNPVLYRG